MSPCLLSRQLINRLVSCLEAGETQGEECPCHTVWGVCGCFSGGQVAWHWGVPDVAWLTTRVSPLWGSLPHSCIPPPTHTNREWEEVFLGS